MGSRHGLKIALATRLMAAVGIAAFLAAHKDATQLESGKVLCKTTGHELLPQLELLLAHWDGKTYKKKVRPGA
jgi:hypothetical protein